MICRLNCGNDNTCELLNLFLEKVFVVEIFVQYKTKSGKLDNNYYDAVERGVQKYITYINETDNKSYINLSKYEPRNYQSHIESSFLCHGIWNRLMNEIYDKSKIGTGSSFSWSQNKGEQNITFHFDIMNNAKISKNNLGCFLAKKCKEKKRKEWGDIYHSIGNMTPIPWFKLYNGSDTSINTQSLHKSLDERWDLFLKLLQNNWNNWNTKDKIAFNDYMILTCQQMYFDEIYTSIKEREINTIALRDITEWNEKIQKSNSNYKLISFSPADGEQIDDIVNKIIKLIKIRCKVIALLLNKKK